MYKTEIIWFNIHSEKYTENTVQCTKCALHTVQGTSMYKVVLHTVRKYYKVHTACNCVCTLPEAESNLTNEHLLFVVLRAPLHKV